MHTIGIQNMEVGVKTTATGTNNYRICASPSGISEKYIVRRLIIRAGVVIVETRSRACIELGIEFMLCNDWIGYQISYPRYYSNGKVRWYASAQLYDPVTTLNK